MQFRPGALLVLNTLPLSETSTGQWIHYKAMQESMK
jgi:hypothetical protein